MSGISQDPAQLSALDPRIEAASPHYLLDGVWHAVHDSEAASPLPSNFATDFGIFGLQT
jgi:hypothetical protein